MSTLTLYLGIYNGEMYIESLLQQIKSQDCQDFKILVVDNKSSDRSIKMIKSWTKFYKNNIQIIENKTNYGGHGSLIKNIGRINTPWFCTFHQDDFYKSNHVSTIYQLISNSTKNTVGVSTTMGSMLYSGKIVKSKPRANWFAQKLDQPGQFLQNLRAQAVPFPATAFKLDVFKKTIVPFHSAAFSDTEQTLKMLSHGIFLFSEKETMYYRENPNSESHVINKEEKIIAASIGISRVLCSKEFETLLDKIDKNKRGMFADQLLNALRHRIPNSNSLITIENIALEQMISKWGYTEKSVSKMLGSNYAKLNSKQTVDVINNLSGNQLRVKQTNKQILKESVTAQFWSRYFNSFFLNSHGINKCFLINVYKFLFMIKPNHRFKNKWK